MKYIIFIVLLALTGATYADCIDNDSEVKTILELRKTLVCLQATIKNISSNNKEIISKQNKLKNKVESLNRSSLEKKFLDLNDRVENNRTTLNSLQEASKNTTSSFKSSCNKLKLIKENKTFRATVEEFSQKGKSINISISVKNKTKKGIEVSRYNTYAILTSPSGEVQKKSTSRETSVIGAEDSRAYSYNFILKEEYDGNAFDYILIFERPEYNFAFFGLTTACFQ